VKALCSDCGSEVETTESAGRGLESYRCPKCGARGTVSRKAGLRSQANPARGDAPLMANISLNILDLVKVNASGTQARCPHCGGYVSERDGRCLSCDQETSDR
jgi:predicted RNA-binding Zn-ribbon protein involved in translation (DUF1610 family)